jgi:3-dehydroquinate dehydratase-2
MSAKISIINGPNLNLLGTRETDIYGKTTLDSINNELEVAAKALGFKIKAFQSNIEGEIVDAVQQSAKDCSGIIINPAAYSHTSVAIRDAISAINIPVIEVHLSNIYKREEFRKHSYVSEVVQGVISGFGPQSYFLALEALVKIIKNNQKSS